MRPEVNLAKRLSKIFCLRLVSWEQKIMAFLFFWLMMDKTLWQWNIYFKKLITAERKKWFQSQTEVFNNFFFFLIFLPKASPLFFQLHLCMINFEEEKKKNAILTTQLTRSVAGDSSMGYPPLAVVHKNTNANTHVPTQQQLKTKLHVQTKISKWCARHKSHFNDIRKEQSGRVHVTLWTPKTATDEKGSQNRCVFSRPQEVEKHCYFVFKRRTMLLLFFSNSYIKLSTCLYKKEKKEQNPHDTVNPVWTRRHSWLHTIVLIWHIQISGAPPTHAASKVVDLFAGHWWCERRRRDGPLTRVHALAVCRRAQCWRQHGQRMTTARAFATISTPTRRNENKKSPVEAHMDNINIPLSNHLAINPFHKVFHLLHTVKYFSAHFFPFLRPFCAGVWKT